jgi:hypothetical protein
MDGSPFQPARAISTRPDSRDDSRQSAVASSLRHIIAPLDQIALWRFRIASERAELRCYHGASPSITIQLIKSRTYKSQRPG